MSKQITVRLPDDLVDFMDELVATDKATSRASVVARAMERERRRELATRDLAVLSKHGGYPDLEGLAPAAAGTVLELD
ncbi:Arc/MetJ-type ribon-helix-helix transcriptional regulator [Kribbella aluminosa]|uniref:Arc/MetJ-type ribon-helix-helix transcriptional regulator n=1 Tax=Kribbella aluminosa TaxID=416017 RepID=A0ABS4UZS1_9ACTN|nr:YlcI/YnfO family protein [Kribbella aluminosa]MBP2357111.1 Arc/MetJ-type ribon-helix-helix transcriptional regulator [Kribbella aluminosa]